MTKHDYPIVGLNQFLDFWFGYATLNDSFILEVVINRCKEFRRGIFWMDNECFHNRGNVQPFYDNAQTINGWALAQIEN